MKSHIGPNGPDRCRAQTEDSCKYAQAEDHFSTKSAAIVEYNRRLEEAYGELSEVEQKQKDLSAFDERLRGRNKDLAQNVVALRAQLSGVTFEDANPERAQRRLTEAIAYAHERNNANLMSRLTAAVVLPSGAFKLEDGTRFSTDKALKAYVANKFLEVERQQVLKAIVDSTKTSPPSMSNFAYNTPNGRYELSFKRELDESYFESLPAHVRKNIVSERDSYSIEAAREALDEATFNRITSEQQNLDFVVGNLPDVGQQNMLASKELRGSTGDERVKSGILNLVTMYEKAREDFGSPKERKAELNDYKKSMKIAAIHAQEEQVFLPARSQKNGAIVSRKRVLDKSKVESILTPDILSKITIKKSEVDKEKARALLNDDQYKSLFGGVVAHFKVTQADGQSMG